VAVTVTPTPASGAITAKSTVVKFDIAGLTLNDPITFNAAHYPSEDEVRYYLTFTVNGTELGRSPEFACNADGEWQFNSYIFPEAGAWTVDVRTSSDDQSVKSQAITVA
jgi:hypothetical protein